MNKHFHNLVLGVSVLPALLVMPAMAVDVVIDTNDAVVTYADHNDAGGALKISDGSNISASGTNGVVFENNKSTDHGAGLYYKNGSADSKIVFNTDVTFDNNEVLSSATSGSGAGMFVSGGNVSLLGLNNTFTNNQMNATIVSGRQYKVGGGAIANQSYVKDSGNEAGTAIDSTMVIGRADGTSVNTFTGNTSTTNGGAIMNRAVDTDGNAYLTINGTTTFENNHANINGGAIYNVKRDNEAPGHIAEINMTDGTYTFTGNTADAKGGAIYNEGKMILSNAKFTGNTSVKEGAAIYNTGTMQIVNGEFKNNSNNSKSQSGGGAIAMSNGTATIGGKFESNTTQMQGGAIKALSSDLTISSDTEFKDNYAGSYGGAIFAKLSKIEHTAQLTIGDNVVFENNHANSNGGALHIDGATYKDTPENNHFTVNIKNNVSFINNIAKKQGGAINYLYPIESFTIGSGAEFIGNKVTSDNNKDAAGGAISVSSYVKDTTLSFDKAVFKDNVATSSYDGLNYGVGGAVAQLNGSTAILNFTNTDFKSNKAGAEGGAIVSDAELNITGGSFNSNETTGTAIGTDYKDTNEGGGAIFMYDESIATITGTTFLSNVSGTFGGAISTRGISSAAPGASSALDVSNSNFISNSAVRGGAIASSLKNVQNEDGDITKYGTVITNSTFTSNVASEKGGAIYNSGDITFNGTNIFKGNTAGGVANDIHNLGNLAIAAGTTTLDGGITGTGALTVADGATLNIETASIEQNSMALDGALNATLLNTNKFASLDVASFTSEAGSMKLTLKGVGDYKVFKRDTFDNSKVAFVYDDSLFAAPIWNDNGDTITVSMKSVEDIAEATGLKADTAAAVSHVAAAASNSDSVLLQDLSLKLQEKLAKDTPEAKAAVEHATKAVHPEKESVVQSVSTSVQNTVVSLASARMATPIVGRNGGDVEFTSGGVWAQGLFNKSKQNDAFNGYTRGIALGMDGTINKDWTIGAGYSYAHSDIDGTARNTEIDSNTVFVYGQYKPAEWYVNAIANYTMSDYSERGTVLDGAVVTGDYDVDSFGGALAAGYDFDNGVTPELGLRYMHVNANDYANSYGIKTHMDDTDFLTGVLGAKYAFNVVANKYLTLVPQLNAAVKYDMLSDKNIATVTMPGLNAYTLEGNRLKRIGAEFGIGLGMQYRELNVSVNYDIDVREDYTSQTGMLKFRYNF